MIPQAYITEWASQVPWQTNEQVEQDLVRTLRARGWQVIALVRRPEAAEARAVTVPRPDATLAAIATASAGR